MTPIKQASQRDSNPRRFIKGYIQEVLLLNPNVFLRTVNEVQPSPMHALLAGNMRFKCADLGSGASHMLVLGSARIAIYHVRKVRKLYRRHSALYIFSAYIIAHDVSALLHRLFSTDTIGESAFCYIHHQSEACPQTWWKE